MMVEFDLVAALVGGFVGTVVMTAMMMASKKAAGSSGDVEVAAPGFMGSRWGGMTPLGIVMGHVVYGIVVAALYDAIT
jgi:hypothetical protein